LKLFAFNAWRKGWELPAGLIEPGEPVTLSIALQNIGTANTSQQFVATLQSSGGVTLPTGGPQNYGRLTAGGPPVERSFTFTAASQQLGSAITLTFQLSDSGVNRGTATTTATLGLLLLDADPGVCATGFRTSSPSPCHLTHCVSSHRPPFPVGNFTVICDTDAPSRFTLTFTCVPLGPRSFFIACRRAGMYRNSHRASRTASQVL
jgi:hypothetical protein